MPSKVTLALDTATSTGWAIRYNGTLFSGVQNFQHNAARESPGMRFLRFSKWLRQTILDYGVNLVTYEQSHHRGGAATLVGVGLVSHVLAVCADLGVEHASYQSREIKKRATGKGNAGKPEMIAAASAWAGKDVTDDNEADALLILKLAEEDLI